MWATFLGLFLLPLQEFISSMFWSSYSRLNRFQHYDNFSDTNILEELNTCIQHSIILGGFLYFPSQFTFSENV